MRIAVIDIGTNSTRLLVADVQGEKVERVVHFDLVTTRLGEGIGSGYLKKEAIRRTCGTLKHFLERSHSLRVERVIAAATSAVRDARNREEFLEEARRAGLEVTVLSGEEEAYLSYLGVVAGLAVKRSGLVVMDVGGGSTEFIWPQGDLLYCRSVNVGAVRMTEGGHDDAAISRLLSPVLEQVRLNSPRHLVGVGGTVTTCAAMVQKLAVYDPDRVHGFVISIEEVEDLLDVLSRCTLEERRRLPGLQPERADIITAGLRIVRLVMRELNISCLQVSETDIMHGLAIKAATGVERKNVIIYQ
ncbi:exopolyphosphatase / guanosine-5'-triphosphate,3'-diphosphate pyrophosphatase [Desulfofundulus australicus DSM 11792]|uniref:Exopolyphosphatase / guanosine-5'-triphosphate,3'-diphosphate pyrophosphatase n=1 Tax=Desulfofundulus australicus DSM 11792 TaxID=1121425 RepID=A0A1M4SDC1_9FIRM|nr:Ppx/GppA phosphatase family protein [Desulfofundulus australicus]MDK2887324.1 exopolyphosphatase / guanosine-5-triphosphate,3-diphosphate pyrophosphatase [Thermoanaerobacter sp.]SHE30209.1 exopolyphosphatase / guanosine-5'-triphosphate,3'-diphosphate pyrophosphatase [Desulfofundulus australicus DSM 11792]